MKPAVSTLLPCPFCGCVDIRLLPQPHGFSVDCTLCGAMVRSVTRYKVQAAAAWNNRRAPEKKTPCEIRTRHNDEIDDMEDDDAAS
jgi:Lar family restriction alleviation protein